MKNKITTFLTFQGQAEAAMNFYVSLFDNAKITSLFRYKENEMGKVGSIMTATFVLDGKEFMCIDSPVAQAFSFNPSISLYVDCQSEKELRDLFDAFSEGGKVLMTPANYGFGQLFTWVEDKFGVSWQLNLP